MSHNSGGALWPGLDHIANFINALDSEGMDAKDVRTAIYTECLSPRRANPMTDSNGAGLAAVTQEDRDAAADWRDAVWGYANSAYTRAGKADDSLVRAFARHRLATRPNQIASPAQPGPTRTMERVLHLLRYCPNKQEIAIKLLESALSAQPGAELVPHETGEALVERVARAIDPNLWALFDDPRWFMPNNVNDIAMRKGSLARARRALSAIPEPAVSIADLVDALGQCEDAITEMFRYYNGGETRGSYDGKSERSQLLKAGYRARTLLDKAKSQGGAE